MSLKSVVAALTLLTSLSPALAADIQPDPSRFQARFRLSDAAGKVTFLQLMSTQIKPALDRIYVERGRISNDAAVMRGQGVAVELYPQFWNFHVNYADGSRQNPNIKDEMTGRSYGMGPNGRASDPSDAFYLDELEQGLKQADDAEVAMFYKTIFQIIGRCDARGLGALRTELLRSTMTDFVAVYAAEEDRHLMSGLGAFNWDDALLQATLVGAFHAGQREFAKFYEGQFSNLTFDQRLKSYLQPDKRERATPTRRARLRDYWQFGRSVNERGEQTRSGINVTRRDFERVGQWITEYELRTEARPALEALIRAIDGSGKNIFRDLSNFYISQTALHDLDSQGRSKTRDLTPRLADEVAKLMVRIRRDAPAITDYIQSKSGGISDLR